MNYKNISFGLIFSALLMALPSMLLAEQNAAAPAAAPAASPTNQFSGSITPEPIQYNFVKGDKNKFRETQWTKEGYHGGFEDFEFEEYHTPTDIHASVDGHAIITNNDYEVNALIEKKNAGYVKIEYEEFSKYYDDTGGVFASFPELRANNLGRDLEMQIGHFRVEVGITVEDYPHLSFAYDRHFKDGVKSRLTWAPVLVGTVQRNIGPSFQYVDEVVHAIELQQSHTIQGIELKGEQVFEWSEAELSRQETSLTNTTAANAAKIRVQEQEPKYKLFTTTESAEKWFNDEKVYAGTAYHYMHLSNSELENIFEKNQAGGITNFSNPKQVRGASANNQYNDHSWTGNVMVTPLSWLNVVTNLKTEFAARSGDSFYPQDTTPVGAGTAGANPDGIINNVDASSMNDRVAKIGEGFSFRITSIPNTALYNDFEFEQLRNWLSEDRMSLAGQSISNTGEIFTRETTSWMSRGIWTLGFQTLPVRWLNWTAHFRVNRSNTDYEDDRETGATASGAKSGFIDGMNVMTHELATHFTFKVKPWLKPSVRYRYQVRDYYTRVEDFNSEKGSTGAHIFTYDVTVQPLHNLLVVVAYSPQYASTSTIASSFGKPRFQSDVTSWFLNATYAVNEKVNLLTGIHMSRANNFNDFAEIGLPLGEGYTDTSVSAGIGWKLTEQVELLTGYDYLYYSGDPDVDDSHYRGHMISTQTKLSWG